MTAATSFHLEAARAWPQTWGAGEQQPKNAGVRVLAPEETAAARLATKNLMPRDRAVHDRIFKAQSDTAAPLHSDCGGCHG